MRTFCKTGALPNSFSAKQAVSRLYLHPLPLLLLVVWCATSALAQSQSQPAAQPPAESNPKSQSQAPAQSQSQSSAQSQSQSDPKTDSLADAARKARVQKGKSATGKVFTEDDLSGLPGNTVSVVGQESSAGVASSKSSNLETNGGANSASDEAYWRGRARELQDQIAAVDRQIAQVQEEIKKYGNGGFDPSTGLNRNVIYVDDRATKLKRLEKRKEDQQKQMQALEEEGRKAGAPPGWFR
ncbi:MAG: hypothetical protein WBC04_00685 [Candidatus Acidiferrales bacterium]